MQYVLYGLSIPFLFINYKIIVSDIRQKKIPNKYLLYLFFIVPFYYFYLFFNIDKIDYLWFLLQVILVFLVSFSLYSFWVWSAWDAKYLLVLSLFIPNIWVVSFVWNIAILTIFYLFLFFIYFYFCKCIFNLKFSKELLKEITNDLKEKRKVYKKNKWWSVFKIISKWIVIFLIIFVFIRLARIYLFNHILFSENSNISLIQDFIYKYHFYLLLFCVWLFIWAIYLIRKIYFIIKKKIVILFKGKMFYKLWLDESFIDTFFCFLGFIFLSGFIFYEYKINPYEITNSLYKIFTFYIFIYIIFKIFFYSYKITFWIAENYYVNVKDFKDGDIFDKQGLIKIIWDFPSLSNALKMNYKIKNRIKRKLIVWNHIKYINSISNPIDKEDLKRVNKIIYAVNKIIKSLDKKWRVIQKINHIKLLKTFAFWIYIFFWFLITYFLQNKIFEKILELGITAIKHFSGLW